MRVTSITIIIPCILVLYKTPCSFSESRQESSQRSLGGPLTWSARIVIVFAAAPLGNYTVGVAIVFVNEVFATENAVRTAAIPNQPTRLRNLLYLVPVMIQ